MGEANTDNITQWLTPLAFFHNLPSITPSFPICTSFNRKLTCRLKGAAWGNSDWLRLRVGGWSKFPPSLLTSHSNRLTSRSNVAILASFVSRSTRTVLLEGEGTISSWDWRVRNVSLAASSSCTDRGISGAQKLRGQVAKVSQYFLPPWGVHLTLSLGFGISHKLNFF